MKEKLAENKRWERVKESCVRFPSSIPSFSKSLRPSRAHQQLRKVDHPSPFLVRPVGLLRPPPCMLPCNHRCSKFDSPPWVTLTVTTFNHFELVSLRGNKGEEGFQKREEERHSNPPRISSLSRNKNLPPVPTKCTFRGCPTLFSCVPTQQPRSSRLSPYKLSKGWTWPARVHPTILQDKSSCILSLARFGRGW